MNSVVRNTLLVFALLAGLLFLAAGIREDSPFYLAWGSGWLFAWILTVALLYLVRRDRRA